MACRADRLSDLPDDLLLRVLHFAPAKEAASTTALSRGWRSPLWRSSGAVNLETRVETYHRRSYGYGLDERKKQESDEALFFCRRDAFLSAAEAALDAADVPVKRLTVRLESHDCEDSVSMFLYGDIDRDRVNRNRVDTESDSNGDSDRESGSNGDSDREGDSNRDSDREGDSNGDSDSDSDDERSPPPVRDVLAKLISHRAVRQMEELQLAAEDWSNGNDAYKDDEITSSRERGTFTLSLASLPSDTLRVLELTGCKSLVPLPPDSVVVFLRLTSLRLRHCTARVVLLQSLLDAAPALAAINLESVTIVQQNGPSDSDSDYEYYDGCNRPPPAETVLLSCPAATDLVLEGCCWKMMDRPWPYEQHTKDTIVGVEIDAPRLRRFRFRGVLRPVSLIPPPPDLAHADLHFVPSHDDKDSNERDREKKSHTDPSCERYLVKFWRFLQSLANARELKLRVTALEHIAVLTKARRSELLPVFPNLHHVELQGVHRRKAKTAAVAIANLLRCCPALRDLVIHLTVAHHEPEYPHSEDVFLQRKFQSDSDKSVCLFNRYCNSATMTTPVVEGANYDEEVSEIPGLSRRSFDCLRSSLTRVGLQFRLEDGNSFGVNLIKFFGENAMVLEEMCIDGGNEKLDDHMTCKVERWIADSFIRRKPGASRFVVLPLKRQL